MLQTTKKYVGLVMLTLITASCATIFTGTKDDINIDSKPEQAGIYINGIKRGETPSTVSVKRPGLDKTYVVLKKDGYKNRRFLLESKFNAVSVINLGSVLGWGVDILSGAVKKYDRHNYVMKLDKNKETFRLDELKKDKTGRYIIPNTAKKIIVRDYQTGLKMEFKYNK